MAETDRAALRRLLVLGYDELKARLTRRLGSAELASDALHEAYLTLDRVPRLGHVRNMRFYLLRTAFNFALKQMRAERRFVGFSDVQKAVGIADETPGQARVLEARIEVEALKNAIAELTPRRREILLAARIEGVTLRDIAVRLGVSQRLVEIELKHALAHCALRLDREIIQRFGPRPRGQSSKLSGDF
jgi:RNA polymerase sigma factor (sigma-70 family)